jgi:hypothetical protein
LRAASRRLLWWSVGQLACAWLVASAVPARAQGADLRVSVADGACPDADLLARALAPVLGDARLAFDAGAPEQAAAAAARSHAQVTDLGDRYRVAIDGVEREIEDPARDCLERARVAAVFIALNRHEAPSPAPTPPAREPAPAKESAPADEPERTRFGVQLFGAGAYAPETSGGAPGGGAGMWLADGAWRLELSTGVLAATSVDLKAAHGVSGAVALTRVPSTLSASYLLRAGLFRFGPTLGFALDMLRLHGMRVPEPQTALRANPGALAALDAHARLGATWLALLRFSLSAFPRAYALAVDEAGQLGRTPRLWLAATLGIEWEFR